MPGRCSDVLKVSPALPGRSKDGCLDHSRHLTLKISRYPHNRQSTIPNHKRSPTSEESQIEEKIVLTANFQNSYYDSSSGGNRKKWRYHGAVQVQKSWPQLEFLQLDHGLIRMYKRKELGFNGFSWSTE